MGLFKRYFWVAPVLVAAICLFFVVTGVGHVMAARAMTPSSVLPPETTTVKRPKKPRVALPVASKDEVAVAERNLFCSSCAPVTPTPTAATPAEAPVDPNAPPPTTALPLSLLATMVVDADGDLSNATIAHTAEPRSGLYRLHDVIPGAGDVVAIRPKWVDLHNDASNRVERLYLVGVTPPAAPVAPPPPVAAPPVAEAPAAPAGSPEELTAAIDKGIQKVSETSYTIDRALINRILNDPTQVMRGGRIGPYTKDGKSMGFKFYTVRANSAYAKIGLQTGDVLQAVNGFEITGPDKALEVYTKLKSASNLSLTILRNDQPMTMQYTVR